VPLRVVIVGNGMAGFRLCQRLGDAADRVRVTVFGEERAPAYDRVHLTSYLARPELEPLLLAPRRWYDARGFALHTGDPVVAIDRSARRVRSAGGRAIEYDRLVLATGSAPRMPPGRGRRAHGVFVYRTVEDLDAIRSAAASARRAVILGGGLLGLEAARGLQELGLEVTVLECAPQLLPRQLDPASAAALRRQIEALGIAVRLATNTTRIERGPRALLVTTDRHELLSANLIVLAAGIQPRDELARAAGLAVAAGGGVEVDDTLTTSDPDILAIGECASHRGQVFGLVAPCQQMADVAARRLLGRPARFTGGDRSCRLAIGGVEVAVIGDVRPDADRARLVHATAGTRRTVLVERGRVVGACAIGPWRQLGRVEAEITGGRRLPSRRLERFRRTGDLWRDEGGAPVARWPAATPVCSCKRVSRGQLSAEIRAGARDVESLGCRTGAGTVCGSCRPLLAELCGQRTEQARPRAARGLARISALALAACAALVWLSPLGTWRITEDARVSGFALLGVCALALLLPARKRVPWLRRGNIGWYRLLHAGVGLSAVALMAAHTGVSLGDNFNRALALVFLGVVGTGAVVGMIAAVEAGAGRAALLARRGRPLIAWSHWLLLWVLPVMVAFHVVATYYY
jgi:nitrite reductase (NADH) large subunit